MKARRIILGVGLLVLAGGIAGHRMGIIPYIPIWKIIPCLICVILILSGLRRKNFFLILMPLAYIFVTVVSSQFMVFSSVGSISRTYGAVWKQKEKDNGRKKPWLYK